MSKFNRPAVVAMALCLLAFTAYSQKPKIYVQTGHSNLVTSVAFAPDGKTLASGSWDGTIKLWDVLSGEELKTIKTGSCIVPAFSPDGKMLASGCDDGSIHFWDVATALEIEVLKGRSNYVRSVAFDPNGKFLVSGNFDGTITLWDLSSRQQLRTFVSHAKLLTVVVFSPDGKIIASGADTKVTLWEVASGRELKTLNTPRNFISYYNNVTSVAFSPDGKTLACGSWTNSVKLWDVESGRELATLKGHKGTIESVMFSPDGKTLITGSDDTTVKLWNANSGQELKTFTGHSGRVNSVAFSSDGKTAASGSFDHSVRLWDVRTGTEAKTLAGHAGAVSSVAFSPDGKTIASGNDRSIELWNLASAPVLASIKIVSGFLEPIAFSPNGKLLAGSDGHTIKLWDAASLREVITLKGHAHGIGSIAFGPDGTMLASGSSGGKTIILWDVATGQEIRSFDETAVNTTIAFSPNGKLLASASGNGGIAPDSPGNSVIRIWEVNSGRVVMILKGHLKPVRSVAFSPDGNTLASGSEDGSVKLWETATGRELKTLPGPSGCVVFSPDGKLLAAGGGYQIKLWNLATGQEVRTLAGHSSGITSIAFSPDGKMLASGSSDATTRLWNIDSGVNTASLIALDEKDWVVVTPEGLFDGTADGMKLIRYLQGNQLLPLDAFFEQFYTPKLLAQVFSKESLPAGPISVDFTRTIKLPPLVSFISPQPGTAFTSDAVRITVAAADQGGGVDEIRLYQNGKLVSDATRQLVAVAGNNDRTFNVTLVPGVNTFRATAFNKDRTEANPVELQIELKAAEAASDLYILAVGLNDYENEKYDLNYGRADAQAFANAVEQHGQHIFHHIYKQIILDRQATLHAIVAAFDQIIAQAKPQDAFVFYFSGHGVMSEATDQAAAQFYLVPYDVVRLYGDDGGLATNGLAGPLLTELSRKVRAQKQLIVLDACQAAGALEGFAIRGAAEEKAVLQLARSAGIVVLAATGQDQVATEFAILGHGVFTYALLQALNGEADGGNPPDGKITAAEIVAFINDRVPELTRQYRGKMQYPNAWVRGQDFPLGLK